MPQHTLELMNRPTSGWGAFHPGWLRRTSAILIAAGLATISPALISAGSVIYTGRHALRIPFEYKAEQLRKLQAAEVHLLVSQDQGKRWKTVAKAKPDDRLFRYNAAENGEYWFAVQLVDSQSRPVQTGAVQVGLKVQVDDISPVLDLKARELTPGRVELTWLAEDDALNIETLEIQYRLGEKGDWQPVEGVQKASGQVNIPVTESTTVFVAGRVSDFAKNEVTVAVNTAASASPVPGTTTQPDFNEPVANQRPIRVSELPIVSPRVITESPIIARPIPQPISQHSNNAPIQVNPSNTLRHPTPTYPSGAKLIHTTNFNIGYTLEQVGSSGVGAVDLFITENNGRNWFYFGNDPDRQSPFAVSLKKGGQYGFTIRVRSGVGLSEDPPDDGDLPDTVIVVDTIAPRPRLNSLQQGGGSAHNQLQINWSLIENDLPPQSVMLSYSTTPNGPWEPMSSWIENTGRYLWTVDRVIDKPVYIRLEARDLAGNVAHVDSEQAIPIDMVKPTARIVEIETAVQ